MGGISSEIWSGRSCVALCHFGLSDFWCSEIRQAKRSEIRQTKHSGILQDKCSEILQAKRSEIHQAKRSKILHSKILQGICMVRLQGATGDDTFSVSNSGAFRLVLMRLTVRLPNGSPVRSKLAGGWEALATPLGSQTADRVHRCSVTTLGLAPFY